MTYLVVTGVLFHSRCVLLAVGKMSSGAVLHLKWDPKNLEIRTKSVEKTLEPLVTQVTTASHLDIN